MTRPLAALIPPLLWAWSAGAGAVPTYSKDVAPILWKNCAGCHRPGEVGPFPLLSFKDAAKRADFLKEITASRRMPPWKPEPGFGEFHDVRRLAETEVKVIADWVDAGAPEGDPKDLPPTPKFPEGWQLGTPDLVLKMAEAFPVPADGRDLQRCFVIPIPGGSDRTVAAVEFRPGNRRVVHHAIFYLDSAGQARRKDAADPGPGYASFGGPGFLPTGSLGGWAPGALARPLPEGIGRYLKAGSDLILQIHYHPDGKPELDQSTLGVTFTKAPARSIVRGEPVRSRSLSIPAGESRHHVQAEGEPLAGGVRVIGVTPHMHNVGREMKAEAQTPDGRTIPLIWIKDWDFNWQGQYQYKEPVVLPEGSIVRVDAYYDNSAGNPRNPSDPPRLVRWGEQTTDEMCILFLQIIPGSPEDARKLAAARLKRLGGSALAGLGGRGAGAGLAIPERFRDQLTPHDADKDGRISAKEIEAMPEPLKQRVQQAIGARGPGGP